MTITTAGLIPSLKTARFLATAQGFRLKHPQKAMKPVNYQQPISTELTPKQWGPPTWKLLHGLAAVFDNRWPQMSAVQRQSVLKTIASFEKTLPCPNCCSHFAAFLKTKPLPTNGTLSAWAAALHAHINAIVSSGTQTVMKNVFTTKIVGRHRVILAQRVVVSGPAKTSAVASVAKPLSRARQRFESTQKGLKKQRRSGGCGCHK